DGRDNVESDVVVAGLGHAVGVEGPGGGEAGEVVPHPLAGPPEHTFGRRGTHTEAEALPHHLPVEVDKSHRDRGPAVHLLDVQVAHAPGVRVHVAVLVVEPDHDGGVGQPELGGDGDGGVAPALHEDHALAVDMEVPTHSTLFIVI